MLCDHDRPPGAMFTIVSGEHARLTAALTIITKRESPWKRQADIIQIEGGMWNAVYSFCDPGQHCAVASAARVTPPAPLHPSSERMDTHLLGPLANQRSEVPC